MAENEKREFNYHANMEAAMLIPQHKRLVTNIGAFRGATEKFEIYFLIPETEEEAKSRYDCSLASLVEMGVRQIATRIDYPSVMFDENDNLKEGGHEAGQVMANGYKVGAKREAGITAKKAKAELDNIQKSAGEVDMDSKEALQAYVTSLVKKTGGLV